jgi:hypothetical protein
MKADVIINFLQLQSQGRPQDFEVTIMQEVQGDDRLHEYDVSIAPGATKQTIYIYRGKKIK